MRIAGYTLDAKPSRQEAPISVEPRTKITPTIGGTRLTIMPGHIGDELHTIPFSDMEATPAKTLLRTYADVDTDADTLTPGQMLGFEIPVAADTFAAVSAARLRLKENGAMAGHVSIEVWDSSGGLPNTKRGVLGYLRPADIGVAYENFDLWSMPAWLIESPEGWLVLNGEELTAGIVSWAGEAVILNAHTKATPFAGTSASDLNPSIDMTGDLTENKLLILVDGDTVTHEVTFNWAGCNTGLLIAAQMQAVIQALGGVYAAVTVDYFGVGPDAPPNDYYLITSGTTGAGSSVNIADAPADNACDELLLGAANGGTETAGGATWALANGEMCASVWQGADLPVLLGICDHYGSLQQSVELELDNDSRILKAVLADVSARNRLAPWSLDAKAWANNVALRMLIEEELS